MNKHYHTTVAVGSIYDIHPMDHKILTCVHQNMHVPCHYSTVISLCVLGYVLIKTLSQLYRICIADFVLITCFIYIYCISSGHKLLSSRVEYLQK